MSDKMRELVQQAVDLQKWHYGNGMGLHLAMMGWADAAREALAQADQRGPTAEELRAQRIGWAAAAAEVSREHAERVLVDRGAIPPAQAEQRGEVAPVATAYIDRQRLDGSWDMVARFTAPADPSSSDGLPRNGIKVYTAPPAPVVPDDRPLCYSCGCRSDVERNWMGRSICSKCRAAAPTVAAKEVPRG